MSPTFQKEFDIAKELIVKASAIAMSYFEQNPRSRLKADDSLVTEADEAVEIYIRTGLGREFPSYGFIGEESNADKKDISWIVDPIDGTISYSRGISGFSTVIGLMVEGEMVLSIIHLPISTQLYHAKLSEGAFKNGKSIKVSQIDKLKEGIISIDRRSPQVEYSSNYTNNFIKEYRVRIGDPAGAASGLLAQGSIDVLIKFYQKIWDTAPECLLMKEAGAIVTNEFGEELSLDFSKESIVNYIATTPSLYDTHKEILYFQK